MNDHSNDRADSVDEFGFNLANVPEAEITPELCFAAVSQDGNALMVVPDKFITAELCLEAVSRNGFALQFVPERFKTLEVCAAACGEQGFYITMQNDLLRYVPEALKEQVEAALAEERKNALKAIEIERQKAREVLTVIHFKH